MSGNQLDKVNPAPQEVSSSPDPLNPVVAGTNVPKRGRPALNRTPEEKREMRKLYMRKYRVSRGTKGQT